MNIGWTRRRPPAGGRPGGGTKGIASGADTQRRVGYTSSASRSAKLAHLVVGRPATGVGCSAPGDLRGLPSISADDESASDRRAEEPAMGGHSRSRNATSTLSTTLQSGRSSPACRRATAARPIGQRCRLPAARSRTTLRPACLAPPVVLASDDERQIALDPSEEGLPVTWWMREAVGMSTASERGWPTVYPHLRYAQP